MMNACKDGREEKNSERERENRKRKIKKGRQEILK